MIALKKHWPTNWEEGSDRCGHWVADAGHPIKRCQLWFVEPCTMQRCGNIDRCTCLVGSWASDLITRMRWTQVFKYKCIWFNRTVQATRQFDSLNLRSDFRVKAMFAIPNAHHFAHHLTTGVGRREFDDDARWNVLANK